MKKIFLLLLLFTGIVKGQIVNIPDANFKAKLISLGVDTNLDGQIQNSEAENITLLNLGNSGIQSLEGLNAFVNLENLDCNDNLFSILDISQFGQLEVLYAESNPNLTFLLLKNGLIDFNVPPPLPAPPLFGRANFSNCPNLQYICCDEDKYQNGLIYLSYYYDSSNITLNSYCSFAPGGDYNTITGNILYDPIGDGCDVTGIANPYIGMNINDGVNSGSTICDSAGNYRFYTQSGDFTITPAIENPSYFDISPANAVLNFPAADNSVQTQNFCMTPTAVAHPDLEIVFIPLDAPIPGSEPRYKIVLRNNGNQTMSGTYSVRYDGDFMTWIAAIPSELQITPEFIIWQFTNLIPFETRIGQLTMRLRNVPLLNPGDTFEFVATINPIPGDETPLDNVSTYTQTAVAVAVANNIECIEGQTMTINEVGAYLHYNVNFRNQALANATNVVVKCNIDPTKFDINSFQLQYASHQVITKVTGNILEIIFKNINLVSVISSPIGGHGNVLFKIKTLPTLVIDDEVLITATIYFDYDLPITTNDARTSIRALTTINFDEDKSIVISPNPAKHNVFVNSKNLIKTIELYDIQGRLLQISYENKTNTILDISNKSNGVYFLKVTTEKGSSVEKLVKEN